MEKIVVNDTNVFIDLLDVGLLDKFFLLPWEIHTTDFVMLELLREGQKETVEAYKHAGKFNVAEFDFDELMAINSLHKRFKENTNVSLTDCSVWYYAKQNNYTLLTGNRKLRNSAVNEGIEVRGIIHVFDKLVETGTIPSNIAAEKLALLKELNPRLPQTEIEKRLKMWNGEQNEKGGSQ